MASKKSSTSTSSAKTAGGAAAVLPADLPRRLRRPKRSWRLKRSRIKFAAPPVPKALPTSRAALEILWRHKTLFAVIALVYGLLTFVLAQGFSAGADVSSLKNTVQQTLGGQLSTFSSGLGVFALMVGSGGGNTSDAAGGSYQFILFLVGSLAVIWAFRQVQTGLQVRARDAYYRGMYPLVPFVLVLLVIGLELLPMAGGVALFATVSTNGLAVNGLEQFIWVVIFLALALFSLYLIASSIMALYIVTLPDMTPRKALRSARELVRFRRWRVLLRILWLPVAMIIVGAIIMLPIIIFVPVAARWVYFVLSVLAVLAAHGYLYELYRGLLDETA